MEKDTKSTTSQEKQRCWNCKYLTTDSNCEPKCTYNGPSVKGGFEWCEAWQPDEKKQRS